MDQPTKLILEVQNLNTSFVDEVNEILVLKDFSLSLRQGETLGIVGETGSGKTISMLSLLGLMSDVAKVTAEKIIFLNKEVSIDSGKVDKSIQSSILAKRIAIIFQNAQVSLNPLRRCGDAIIDIMHYHKGLFKKNAKDNVLLLFSEVGLSDPKRIYGSFPHQLSGGEQQRVLIAMGLSCEPEVLILDEPTASLDLITQKEIIDLLQSLQQKRALSMIFITHDLATISEISDTILHIDKGKIIAYAATSEFFIHPPNPISAQLVSRIEDFTYTIERPRAELLSPGIKVEGLSVSFGTSGLFRKRATVDALKNINLIIYKGTFTGIIGASGSGKTTLAKCIAGIISPDSGEIIFEDVCEKVSYIFQDAYNALDPDLTVGEILSEVLKVSDKKLDESGTKSKVAKVLNEVKLDDTLINRKINEISGGQRQRVNIARAILIDPDVYICDEITSGLDLNVQYEIIQLLKKIAIKKSLIFISHDIGLVKYFCDRLIIMKEGEVVEEGWTADIMKSPKADYTTLLINSIPKVKYLLKK